MARADGRTSPPRVRHRPAQAPHALADYVAQSLASLEIHHATASGVPTRRRDRPRKTPRGQEQKTQRWAVRVRNRLEPEELEDDDEYGDIVAELRDEFEQFGGVVSLDVDRSTGIVVVAFNEQAHAAACVHAKHGQMYGGRELEAAVESESRDSPVHNVKLTVDRVTAEAERLPQKKKRTRRSKIKSSVFRTRERNVQSVSGRRFADARRSFVVRRMVEADEVEDDDECEDVVKDVRDVLGRYGELQHLSIVREQDDEQVHDIGDVVVEYVEADPARAAYEALNGSKYGGRTLECRWVESPDHRDVGVCIDGMVEADELEDDDEYMDVCEEVEGFIKGIVETLRSIILARDTGQVTLQFATHAMAVAAVTALSQKKYGGKPLQVRLEEPTRFPEPIEPRQPDREIVATPSLPVSEALASLLIAFLQRLASLQERAHVQNPSRDRRSRRLVLGLHEVRRGVQSNKIKLLLLAIDFDQSDVLDEKLHEIIAIATRENIPVIRALTRRKLGKVFRKHARMSCVGVYSYEGANELFRDIIQEHERLQLAVTKSTVVD